MAGLSFTLSKIKTSSSPPLIPSTSHSPPMLPQTPPTPNSTFSHAMIQETIETAQSLITLWHPSAADNPTNFLFRSAAAGQKKDAYNFIASVAALRHAMISLLAGGSSSDAASQNLRLAHSLLQLAMQRLEKEFYLVLSAHRHRLDSDSVHYSLTSESGEESPAGEDAERLVSAVALADLKSIADCMISCGYGKECLKIYTVIRKSVADEGLYRLGIQRLRSSKVRKMKWPLLEQRIRTWIDTSKVVVKTIFQKEKILCDRIFSASDAIRDAFFAEISKEGATNLLTFPELVAKSRKKISPEKIFPLLELHEAISNLWPDIESVFSFESTAAIRTQALAALHKIGDAVRAEIADFESAVQKDSSRTPVIGGGIHPLTRLSMEFLARLADYGAVLSDIVAGDETTPPARSPVPEYFFATPSNGEEYPTKAVSELLAWLVLVLLCKLDGKAELYKDVSLSYLFLTNNLHFIVGEIRSSNLRNVLGGDWITAHAAKVKQYAASYETTAWSGVLAALPGTGTADVTPAVAKECFRRFNAAIEAAQGKQKSWLVADKELRDEIKASIARNIVPAYREFYDASVATLSGEKNLERLVKFAPEDLGNYLSDLLSGGNSGSSSPPSSDGSSTSTPT